MTDAEKLREAARWFDTVDELLAAVTIESDGTRRRLVGDVIEPGAEIQVFLRDLGRSPRHREQRQQFSVTVAMIPTAINGRWSLLLPAHRAERAEWDIANGGWEVARIASMAEHLGPGDVLYDCGAEEGDMTALFGTFGAEVVAIEANPMVWPCLKATWEANVDRPLAGWYVGFVGADIAERPPMLDVNAQPVDGWPECAYGEMIPAHGFRHLYQQADATPTITLDALVERIGIPPTALTLDCEGSELAIMRGAGDVLAKHRPLVWISVHDEFMGYYGHSPEMLDDYMAALDYDRTFLAEDHERHVLWTPK